MRHYDPTLARTLEVPIFLSNKLKHKIFSCTYLLKIVIWNIERSSHWNMWWFLSVKTRKIIYIILYRIHFLVLTITINYSRHFRWYFLKRKSSNWKFGELERFAQRRRIRGWSSRNSRLRVYTVFTRWYNELKSRFEAQKIGIARYFLTFHLDF